ncbi:uncharacterized protein ATNIH1004_002602 [Aspergillus tanneri]|uniref:Uncharacterized protein n=1 Tax=Aspergillus tanneri TaxID=1220188 RepID=A0A5M9MYF9_9EURO|nr:uncharacterized protein ATNIH1004_002602 [Aspergillus tanneri]KAA8649923.1 hypothetical protein ATNIH1004_002602 [Aspergillus tanneri]
MEDPSGRILMQIRDRSLSPPPDYRRDFNHGISGAALSKAHTANPGHALFHPMRLNLEPNWSVTDLLYYVRDQKAQTARYDSVELRDIVEKSTEWASGTQFGYIYQHQNIDNNINLSLGTAKSGMGGENEFDLLDTLWIISIPEK